MNQKKAKALRKQISFTPTFNRLHKNIKRGHEEQEVCIGTRRMYQDIKHGRTELE